MPPRRLSRYSFSIATRDDEDRLALYGAEPYRYRELPDTIPHVVRSGETLHSLAGRYYAGHPRPWGLWWVIAHFQPDPIHDPTVRLEPGRTLFIPSPRTLVDEIFSEKRRPVL